MLPPCLGDFLVLNFQFEEFISFEFLEGFGSKEGSVQLALWGLIFLIFETDILSAGNVSIIIGMRCFEGL